MSDDELMVNRGNTQITTNLADKIDTLKLETYECSHDANSEMVNECISLRIQQGDDPPRVRPTRPICWRKMWSSCFPLGLCYEFKQLIRLALPITVTSLFTFTFGPVSIAFCGHLGKTELATIGLSMAVFNMAGIIVVTGLLTACDTIFAQTYGSKTRNKISMQMKKALTLITICCIPCCALYISVEGLLLLLGQNPMVAKLTASYLLRLIPALLFYSWGQVFTRYVQSQNHVYAPLIFTVLTNGVNALLHYIFLFQLRMGINGSAMAQAVAYLFQDISFLFYIKFSKTIVKFNTEHSIGFLKNWSGWFRLAIPGVIMVSLDGTLFELGGILAGSIGERELAVQTVLITLDTVSYTLFPHGFGTATGIRVGQYLGGQVPLGPRSTLSVALLLIWILEPFYFMITVLLRWHIPLIFSRDSDVIEMAANLIPLTAIFQILDGAHGICTGVLRGAGLQHVGCAVNFLSLYFVGVPVILCLVFLAKMSIQGIWIGLIAGSSVQITVLLLVCFRMNWNKQAELTKKRLNAEELRNEMSLNVTEETDVSPTFSRRGSYASVDEVKVEKTPETNDYDKSRPKNVPYHLFTNTTCTLLRKRMLVLTGLLFILVASILCRTLLNLSDYFGPFCFYKNGTYIQISHLNN
ncbi:hypothetical protein EG68_04342 [Paragonimus skrjabini miyazakii]|uniref:Multidrug and toxin extrusion protein n=1 Tax=Paragonimus skrjabini miyazakii TaxID=59628 RepID=A0A8S9YAQ2_9TREM|nr:hypothetical protein EG68_04342 [Paragonimus skrjabini miyazakii]